LRVPASILSWLSRLPAQAAQGVWRELDSLFDSRYYAATYPDVAHSRLHPLTHFLLFGAREGRRPNPFFDATFYRAANPGLGESTNPLLHYSRRGWKQDQRPNEWFDPVFYRAANALPEHTPPLVHYIEAIRSGRQVVALPDPADFLPAPQASAAAPPDVRPVDIIVRVCAGLEKTKGCLESILGSECRTPFDLILLRDSACDAEVTAYLGAIATAHGARVIEGKEHDLSLTPAIQLHPDRDVVLLHGHARVAGDWLDRLAAAAHSGPRTGTATPFTNDGGLFSYPLVNSANAEPHNFAEIDRAAREVNCDVRLDVPGIHGHCAFFRRECLDEAGPLDMADLKAFCKRALSKGWLHLLAADVFVAMQGTSQLGNVPGDDVIRLYGHDPAQARRIALTAALIRRSGKDVILNVSHGFGGGIEESIRKQQETDRAVMLTLEPSIGGMLRLSGVSRDSFRLWANLPAHQDALLLLLKSFGVTRVHIHHLMGHTEAMPRLVRELGVPVDFTIHDYFVVCPQVTLTRADGTYCGEPEEEGCNQCITGRPCGTADIRSWRSGHSWVVTGSDRVLAPSRDTAERFARYFPDTAIDVIPHEEPPSEWPPPAPGRIGADEPLRIAVLGAMVAHKGIRNLRACAALAREQRLPLAFTLIGAVGERRPEPFPQTGRYTAEQLPELVRSVDPHLIWFPGQAPETYSFTLSFTLRHGLPVAAPGIGAFPERLAGRSWTWLLPWASTAEQWVVFFTGVRQDHFVPGVPPQCQTHHPERPAVFPGRVRCVP
jgi:glycosyltransferase involved in cell wall biosynthesis